MICLPISDKQKFLARQVKLVFARYSVHGQGFKCFSTIGKYSWNISADVFSDFSQKVRGCKEQPRNNEEKLFFCLCWAHDNWQALDQKKEKNPPFFFCFSYWNWKLLFTTELFRVIARVTYGTVLTVWRTCTYTFCRLITSYMSPFYSQCCWCFRPWGSCSPDLAEIKGELHC